MARTPSPWFWEDRQTWHVTLDGQRHCLGEHAPGSPLPRKINGKWNPPPVIRQAFHQLMAARPKTATTAATFGELTLIELFDTFLDWCHRHREARTAEWYGDHLQGFLDHYPVLADGSALSIKPFHLVEWADTHPDWSPAYRRGALVAIQRPFRWAAKLGYIPSNPVSDVEKPEPQRREGVVSAADWKRIKAHYPAGDPFTELLEFAWETGCRPQEAKRVEARHTDIGRMRVVFPKEESKGKKRPRIILLTPVAATILAKLVRDRPTGSVFVNADGKPWTAQAMACRFGRLKKHLGVKFAAYEFRHGFCQRLLESGADHLSVAALLGHKDGKMVAEVYSHMNAADGHLRGVLTKAAEDT